jgi:nicotinamidase-related amidase
MVALSRTIHGDSESVETEEQMDDNRRRSRLLNKDETILVIIDMQERLLPVIAEKERILANVVKLVKFARIIGVPVILTEQQKLGPTRAEVLCGLARPAPVGKTAFNCFGAKEFVDAVSGLHRKEMVLAGIEAHVCVAQTALHGLSDHTVHVIGDAVSSRSPQDREIALRRMERQGVVLTSTEMFIFELLEEAGTDLFREVLPLVK